MESRGHSGPRLRGVWSELAVRRVEAGLTQKELGDRIGVHALTIARWEAGKSVPSAGGLSKAAAVLGCTVEDLLENK